jgi:hypothetical protein
MCWRGISCHFPRFRNASRHIAEYTQVFRPSAGAIGWVACAAKREDCASEETARESFRRSVFAWRQCLEKEERERDKEEREAKGEPRTRTVVGGTRSSTPEENSSGEAIQQQQTHGHYLAPPMVRLSASLNPFSSKERSDTSSSLSFFRFVLLCRLPRFCLSLPHFLPFIHQKGATKRGGIYTHKQILVSSKHMVDEAKVSRVIAVGGSPKD